MNPAVMEDSGMGEAEATSEMEGEMAGELGVPVPPAEEGGPAETIRYTVREGDTLWDITGSVWTDPFLWPKVWRNNTYIFNPDLIYPGNVILFPAAPPEPPDTMPDTMEEAMQPEPPPPPVEEIPLVEEAPPPMMEEFPEPEIVEVVPEPVPEEPKEPDFATLASSGFILYGHQSKGKVVAGPDGRELLAEHDIAYILPDADSEMVLGDRLILSRKVRKVYHPKSGGYLGDLIHVLGVAEIINAEDRVKTAKILDSFDYITIEDLAIRYEELESNVSVTGEVPFEREGGAGYIIAVKEGRLSNAEPDVVYLDKGLRDGLEKGNRFIVIRQGEKTRGKEVLPKRVIGQLEILMALDVTSTARVIQSSEPIEKGDLYESP
jgi:hypothetical protein